MAKSKARQLADIIVGDGTLDGRDVSVDGTKLDGIETAADVTDTANVTAAGALMDSEVTNLAQVKAFDSSDYATSAQGTTADSALQNVVEDTSPQLGGNLDLNSSNITGTGNINITGNLTTTGYIAGPATFTIDPAAVGDNTGTLVVAGNLQVDGTTTTINSTTMTVDDLNITLASGAANAAAANGAGITVDGASATITYDGTNDEWDFNKPLNVTGAITSSGNISGAALLIDSNTAVDKSGSNYMVFHDGAGAPALYAGNTSDNRNYYQSNHHRFRSDDATTDFAELSSAGLRIGGVSTPAEKLHVESGNIRVDGSYLVNATTVIDSSRVVQNVTLGHSNTGARFETNDWMYDTGGKARFYFTGGGTTFFGSDNGYVYRSNSDIGRATISNDGGINLLSGGDGLVGSTVALAVSGTTVIDSSRNLTNIGTISSGAITSSGTLTAAGGELYLGAADTASAHINSYEVMTFNIDSDNDDTNRHFAWYSNGNSGSGTHLMRLTENGQLAIGTQNPSRTLHIRDSGQIKLESTSTGSWTGLDFAGGNGSYDMYMGMLDSDGRFFIDVDSNGEDFTILQNGNVGIGTTSPLEKLDVNSYTGISVNNNYAHMGSTVSGAMAIFGHNIKSDPGVNIIKSANTGYHSSMIKMYYNEGITFHATSGTQTAGDTFYNISGTTNELMRITNTGNVGIGITNPTTKLHVAGIVQVAESSNTAFYGGDYVRVFGSGQQYGFRDTGGTTKANISMTGNSYFNGGNVGIGTSSPAGRLHLRDTTPHLYIQSDDGQSAKLLFGDATDNSRGGIEYMSTDDMKFMNNNLSTVMTLRYTGQVGIGETNPNQDAAVEISKAAPNTGITTLRLTNSVNNRGQRIDFEDDNAARAFTLSHDNGSNITFMGTLVNEPFAFYTNNTERMRIDSSGNVRIGDTDGVYNTSSSSYIPVDTNGRFLTISNDTGAYLNLQSESTGSDQLGGIIWTNRTGAADAHRQVASIDATTVDTTNTYEGGQLRFWTKIAGSANTQPGMIITHNRIVKGNDSEFLGFEDAINILNADPEDGGSDFDQTPTNNADGGQTYWSISNDGDAIFFNSTSGGHSGTWMKVYCDAGLWAIKGSVRLTNTDGAVHGATSSANYKFTHSFRFYISSGPDTGNLKWDADAAASNTGTDFTRAAFSSSPVYMSGGYKTIAYHTNGYNGVQQIYITDLQLVKVG